MNREPVPEGGAPRKEIFLYRIARFRREHPKKYGAVEIGLGSLMVGGAAVFDIAHSGDFDKNVLGAVVFIILYFLSLPLIVDGFLRIFPTRRNPRS